MTDFTNALTDAQAYTTYSYAQNTHQAYASDWHQFTTWCQTHQRRSLPATPETILGYIGTLADRVRVATIDRRLCGIAFYHRQARQPNPTDDPEVDTVLRGLRRKKGIAPTGKAPITITLLRTLVAACDDTYRGMQERALFLLGFAGAFRRSELVALTIHDLTFVPEGLIVRIRRSKSDQEGMGTSKGIPYGTNPVTCPVRAVRTWLNTAGIRSGRLFRTFTPHGQQTTRPLRRYIRDGSLFRENAAAQIGL